MAIEQITVPDFGEVQEITVVDIYVKAGDTVEVEDPLVALESEKAVMDIPSPFAGTITEVKLQEGDTVASDDIIAVLETSDSADQPEKVLERQVVEDDSATAATAPGAPARRPRRNRSKKFRSNSKNRQQNTTRRLQFEAMPEISK